MSYPLSLAAFADTLKIASMKARNGRQQQFSGLGSGEGIKADLAPARRQFDVTLVPLWHTDLAPVLAQLDSLESDVDASFYIYDPRFIAPVYDLDGSIVSGHTVRINTLNGNNKAMTLKALPAGYQLSNCFLSWDYGSSPTRRAYHRIQGSVTAALDGTTSEFEVRDFIRPGSATNAVVTIYKPAFKAQLVENSIDEGASASDGRTALSFSIRQIL